jgi:hypothetical protein
MDEVEGVDALPGLFPESRHLNVRPRLIQLDDTMRGPHPFGCSG